MDGGESVWCGEWRVGDHGAQAQSSAWLECRRAAAAAGTMASLYNIVVRSRRATPAAFREQLDGSDKRVSNLNMYEYEPVGTSSLNDNIIKTLLVLIMHRTLSEHFLLTMTRLF